MARVVLCFFALVLLVDAVRSDQVVKSHNATWGETYKNKTKQDSQCTYQLFAQNVRFNF